MGTVSTRLWWLADSQTQDAPVELFPSDILLSYSS